MYTITLANGTKLSGAGYERHELCQQRKGGRDYLQG